MTRTADQIAARLRQALAPGSALKAPEGSNLYNMLLAAADELVRTYESTDELLDEAFPSTVTQLLDDWEAELGLPSSCYPAPTTIDGRRAAIAAKNAQLGGQTRSYYIGIAAQLGFVITIEEPKPFYVGVNGCGDPVGEINYQFTWIVHCPVGSSTQLACVFESIKPAHTDVFCIEG